MTAKTAWKTLAEHRMAGVRPISKGQIGSEVRSRLKAYRGAGRIQNIDLLIPNIEFRIAPPSDKATALNIHLLVCPDDPEHEQKITNALGRLSWEYNGQIYSCVPDQLIALGHAFDPDATSNSTALSVGVLQFKVDFTTLRDWIKKEHWLRNNSIVVASAGKDGLSGFRQDGSWSGFREEITRFSDMIFSGRPGERIFWLGQRKPEEDIPKIEKLGGFKPCIHGSDAHEIATLFKPDEDRFCWIKSDPTFEGLRQVLYEPEDRVFIGPTPPVYHDEASTIESVSLKSSDGWFEDVTIPFNAGLISVIGQKGSGKSALAEVISYSAGSWETEEKGSFIRRAGEHLHDLEINLNWGDGKPTSVRLGEDQSGDQRVRYLSQRFVERLCSDDHIGDELIKEIEAVVFSYIDETDTLNGSSFSELRALRTKSVSGEGERLRQDVLRLIKEEVSLRDNASKVPDKKKQIAALKTEREGLVKQLPKPANEEEAKLQADLQEKRNALTKAQQGAANDKQKLQKIEDICTQARAFSSQMNRFGTKIEELLAEAGIPEVSRAVFKPAFPGDIEVPLKERKKQLNTSIANCQGQAENPAEGTINSLKTQIEALLKKESADKARQKKITTSQARIATIDTEIGRIENEITQIEGPEKARLAEARKERLESYKTYFENLKKEQKILEELYAPLSKRLTAETSSKQERALEMSIRWEADVETWLKRGSALFDQRRTIPYGTIEDLGNAAKDILLPAWVSGDSKTVVPAMEEFLKEFRKPEMPPASYLRSGISVQDVFEWLFEVQHVRLNYGLKYNGVDLEKLSPGTKGIVLLILYLGMDIADTRPLIVDQPDENLDNESIYQLLTAYFKQAKKRRQIILITHNPNLVVNADSEQVIVATADRRDNGLPFITYQSGSLENNLPEDSGIRQQVCRILEGGKDAFRKREVRYSIRWPNFRAVEASNVSSNRSPPTDITQSDFVGLLGRTSADGE